MHGIGPGQYFKLALQLHIFILKMAIIFLTVTLAYTHMYTLQLAINFQQILCISTNNTHIDATYDKLQGRGAAFNYSLLSFKVKSSLHCAQVRTNISNLWLDLDQCSFRFSDHTCTCQLCLWNIMIVITFYMYATDIWGPTSAVGSSALSSEIDAGCQDRAMNHKKVCFFSLPL